MKIILFLFLLFLPNYKSYNPILYKLKNPIISGSSLIMSKIYIKKLSKLNLNPNLSRKLIHITCAPTFISSWVFYNNYLTKYWATSVPLISSFYLIYKRNNLKQTISRSGHSNELLKGPFIYTILLTYITFKYWLFNEIGIISMLQLSIGDGLADIIGRKYGNHKWIFNKKKSIEGSIGFLVSSFLFSIIIVNYLKLFGYNFSINVSKLFLISLCSSFIELIPYIDDNLTIPLFNLLFYHKIYNVHI